MLTTNQEGSKHQHTIVYCSKCLDTDFSTFYSDNQNNPHLPRGKNKVCHSTETHSHPVTITSLQCYVTTLSFTTMIWTSSISCEHFSWHSKSQHGQHVIIRLLHMTTLGGPPEWNPASPFVQHTISSNYSNLQTHDQWQWTYHPLYITCCINRWYGINLDTIFSHMSLCNGYRITYISWIVDLLLLLLLVTDLPD